MKSQQKFRDYPSNLTSKEWNQVEDLLLACSYSIGITNSPEPEMLQKMCSALRTQNPDINMSELNEAFDMYAFQKLKFTSPHFNSFDLLLLGNIVGSYKTYRAEQMKNIMNTKKPIELPQPTPTKSEENKKTLEYFERALFNHYHTYIKSNCNIYRWSNNEEKHLFTMLEEIEIIKLSIEEKREILDDVKVKLKGEVKNLISKQYAKWVKSKDDIDPKSKGELVIEDWYIKFRCRAESFKRWIQEMGFDSFDIKKLITDRLN